MEPSKKTNSFDDVSNGIIIGMYSLYDTVAEVYSERPWFAMNDNDAKRAFKNALEKNKDMRPQDYVLYRHCLYNKKTGETISEKPSKMIISGIDIARKDKK